MNCGQRQENMLSYLSGTLEESEAAELRSHLAEGCPRCIGALAEARATLQHLPLLLEPVPPASHARERLLKRLSEAKRNDLPSAGGATNEPRPTPVFRWRPVLAAAACAAFAFAATYAYMNLRIQDTKEEIAALHDGIDELQNEATGLERVAEEFRRASRGVEEFMSVVRSSALEVVSLEGAESHPDAWGRLFWDREKNICHVITHALSPAEDGRTYRYWFETEDQQRFSGGDFNLDSSGRASITLSLPEDPPERLHMKISYGPAEQASESNGPVLLGSLRF